MAGISLRDYQTDAVKRMKTVASFVEASAAVNQEQRWPIITNRMAVNSIQKIM